MLEEAKFSLLSELCWGKPGWLLKAPTNGENERVRGNRSRWSLLILELKEADADAWSFAHVTIRSSSIARNMVTRISTVAIIYIYKKV